MRILLYFLLFCSIPGWSQLTANGLESVSRDLDTPTEYEIGPVRVVGADNFDQQAIKAVAGLRQ